MQEKNQDVLSCPDLSQIVEMGDEKAVDIEKNSHTRADGGARSGTRVYASQTKIGATHSRLTMGGKVSTKVEKGMVTTPWGP